jgi:hypothetical protein
MNDKYNDCLMTVDCTDIRIPERGKKFFSFKFQVLEVDISLRNCLCYFGECNLLGVGSSSGRKDARPRNLPYRFASLFG